MLRPPSYTPSIAMPPKQMIVGIGSVWTAVCHHLGWPPPRMALKSRVSPNGPRPSPEVYRSNADWRSRCPANRKDHATVLRQQPVWGGTTLSAAQVLATLV